MSDSSIELQLNKLSYVTTAQRYYILDMNTLRVTLLTCIYIAEHVLILKNSMFSCLMWNGPYTYMYTFAKYAKKPKQSAIPLIGSGISSITCVGMTDKFIMVHGPMLSSRKSECACHKLLHISVLFAFISYLS